MLPRICRAALGALIIVAGMTAVRAAPAVPWRAAATVEPVVEELSFRSGDVTLRGRLFAPPGGRRVPAVVVLHAASSPTHDLPLYRHLTEMLPPLGIAVFVYDRRGSGGSGGDLAASDYAMLADDGIAAQRLLASHRRIDAGRIGFWGLSQGGWLALLAAQRSPTTAFAVSVSAPLTTPDVQMNFAVANILRIRGFGEGDIAEAVAARTAVDDFERGRRDRDSTQAIVDRAATQPWFEHIYMSRSFKDPHESRWAKEMRHDPLATAAQVRVPALLLFGTDDPWVPAQTSVERFRAIASERPNLELHVVRAANHEMATTVAPKDEIDPALSGRHFPDSAEYFAVLTRWLADRVLPRRP